MDIKRPGKIELKSDSHRNLGVIGLGRLGGITFVLAKLSPQFPTLDRSTAVIETVSVPDAA